MEQEKEPIFMKFVQSISIFVRLSQELQAIGYKKKEIAQALDIYPSVLSTLTNVAFKKVMVLAATPTTPVEQEAEIHRIFKSISNVSEKRVRRDIEQYIERLKKLKNTSTAPIYPSNLYINTLIEQSPKQILNQLVGLYECYYLSTTTYRVKKEPFLIQEKQNHYVVRKGNQKSISQYQGFIYLSHHSIITMQLQELDTIMPDNFVVHFQLSPHPKNFPMMKGISTSMSNTYAPVSRKVIIKKVREQITEAAYEQIETTFYDKQTVGLPVIVSYLYNSNTLMEYTPVPRPFFNEYDLEKEILMEQIVPN